ncbi:hypothetical protein BW730_03705 [Tessaracoccus aquimaris]|uniref:DNA-binding protein n=2 Tax=Tessaracoccus aquimaris TaxID=1332264 RepID=A0A1Q2CL17_9ACTN|nr:hypothetical protein BW730_03705 [Tessaracoccus aquimaris]
MVKEMQASGAAPSSGLQTRLSPSEPRFETIEDVASVALPIMQAVCEAVGRQCEMVLHDLTSRDLNHSVYAIYNGKLTGRTVGSPSTRLGFAAMRDEQNNHDAFGYSSLTQDGREMRSSSLYFRNEAGSIIAALCINHDLSPLQFAMANLQSVMTQEDPSRPQELLTPDIGSILESMVEEALESVGKPPALLSKSERIRVIALLEQRGAFDIKRSVDVVAARLAVSKVTVYGYLDEVRRT